MKKILITITIILISLILTGCLNKLESDTLKFKTEYEELNGKNNSSNTNVYSTLTISKNSSVKYVSEQESVNFLKNGTGIVYFGFPNCPWCRNIVPVLLEIANEKSETIRYLNILDIRSTFSLENDKLKLEKKGTDVYYKILDILDSKLDKFYLTTSSGEKVYTGEKRLYAPTVVFVKNGKIIGLHVSTVSSQTDPYKPMTKEQRQELKNIYKNYLEKIEE